VRSFLSTGFRTLIMQKFDEITSDCSPDQARAVLAICMSKKHFTVQGKQGRGKSYVIHKCVQFCTWLRRSVQTTAYTGNAALNCGGMTLHRVFPLFHVQHIWDESKQTTTQRMRLRNLACETLFLDEMSMVHPIIANQILYFAKRYHIQIVSLGDFKQLSPMPYGTDKKNGYFFESQLMRQSHPLTLETCHRQNDAAFLSIIDSVGDDDFDATVCDYLASRVKAYKQLSDAEKEQMIHIFFKNEDVNSWNKRCFDKLPGRQTHVPVRVMGFFKETRNIKDESRGLTLMIGEDEWSKLMIENRILDVSLKQNMPFVFSRNINDFPVAASAEAYMSINAISCERINIANGTQGVILEVLREGVIVHAKYRRFFFPLQQYEIPLQTSKAGDVVTTTSVHVRYYPIILSFAITIHKAQGLTFDRACVGLKNLPLAELAYVAMSRVRASDGLFVTDYSTPRYDTSARKRKFFDNPAPYSKNNQLA
jgi:ATP-dependent DNA helicase PIF1